MMQVYNLQDENSILNRYIAEIRDHDIQNDPIRFRKNMERISEILAYEISKSFDYATEHVQTPLGIATIALPTDQLVITSILRAGLSMHNGFLNRFDRAENAFVSAYREETADHSVKIKVEYKACPDLTDKTVLIVDPMLATGQSMALVYKSLLANGTPKKIIIASTIATPQALTYLETVLPATTSIWTAAIDPELNDKSYIIPGLGDAGDLAYGKKL